MILTNGWKRLTIVAAAPMFNDLFDAVSYLWSWRWPVADGEVTAVDIERIGAGRNKTFRLAVAYEFSLGADGPYTGESFWQPAYFAKSRVQSRARRFHRRQPVAVRYRPDDPSINRLDRSVWQRGPGERGKLGLDDADGNCRQCGHPFNPHIVVAYDTSDFSKGGEVRCQVAGCSCFHSLDFNFKTTS